MLFRKIIADCEMYSQHVYYVGKMKNKSKVQQMVQYMYSIEHCVWSGS
jgi:hypothetical protein